MRSTATSGAISASKTERASVDRPSLKCRAFLNRWLEDSEASEEKTRQDIAERLAPLVGKGPGAESNEGFSDLCVLQAMAVLQASDAVLQLNAGGGDFPALLSDWEGFLKGHTEKQRFLPIYQIFVEAASEECAHASHDSGAAGVRSRRDNLFSAVVTACQSPMKANL